MSEEIHACVIIYPAPGKESRLKELLIELGKEVQEKEKDALKYEFFEHYNSESGRNIFILQEIWLNKAALDAHFATSHFITIVTEIFPKEELLAQPLDMMAVNPVGGFASR